MDLSYSTEELAFRDEVRAWLQTNLPADLKHKVSEGEELNKDDYMRWHRILAAQGWVAPTWPVEWGGTGWSLVQRPPYPGAPPYRRGLDFAPVD